LRPPHGLMQVSVVKSCAAPAQLSAGFCDLSLRVLCCFRPSELAHVEIVVESPLAKQLLMSAAFDDPSPLDHQHEIPLRMVLSRWVMTKLVHPSIRRSGASWMRISVRLSTLLVA
jgi:hypothetical protein